VVTGALEIARRDKVIGASLEAAPVLYVQDEADACACSTMSSLAEIAITSAATVEVGEGPADAFRLPDVAGSCGRLPSRRRRQMRALLDGPAGSGDGAGHDDLCRRCADAVDAWRGGGVSAHGMRNFGLSSRSGACLRAAGPGPRSGFQAADALCLPFHGHGTRRPGSGSAVL
jgi:hypothetical protein